MSKRKLDSKYKDLVEYVNDKHYEDLVDILSGAIREGKRTYNEDSKLWGILDHLYITPLSGSEFGELTKTIVDIYNDNYELEEPKYYWLFRELRGLDRCDLYFGTAFGGEPLLVDISAGGTAKKCTKTELNSYLLDTNLTADNFANIEDIEND